MSNDFVSKSSVSTNKDKKVEKSNNKLQNKQYYSKKKSFFFRKKLCLICQKNLENEINYKNVNLLKRFISERGKILPRRLNGNCSRHQRMNTRAIKQARIMALLPFASR